MRKILMSAALVLGSFAVVSAPTAAHAQYGFYGNFGGGGHNCYPHVRSLVPYGAYYNQAFRPAYGYGYAPAFGGYGPGYGATPYGYAPYGGFGGYNFGGYSGMPYGGISIRW